MSKPTIATLITCHNRKQKTLECLAALGDRIGADIELAIYLVDDGSTDGTAAAVRAVYPQVEIVNGDGHLYWNGGMRLAFATAVERDYDYYLWLNDDTLLYPSALQVLLQTSVAIVERGDERAIVVGATRDVVTGELTYGGMMRQSWLRPLRFSLVAPSETAVECDTLNGNCVLIPRAVARIVGNLDPAFAHYMGDLDYGLRAREQGCTVWMAPGYVGTCSQNLRPSSWSQTTADLPWYRQWQRIGQPKGLNLTNVTLPPVGEWRVFAHRHAGLLWPLYWLYPYLRLLLLPIGGMLDRFGKKSLGEYP